MRRHGYTLVELLIVLAAVVILAALLFPALAQNLENADSLRAQENERRSQCMSNLKQIALGLMQYTQDYNETYPPAAANSSVAAFSHGRAKSENFSRSRVLYGWVELIDPYIPSEKIFQCPSEKHAAGSDPRQARYTDYWLNRNVAGRSLAAMENTARTLLAGDGDGGSAASNARYAINSLPRAWIDTPGSPARRHGDIAAYAFVDGHIKMQRPQRITTVKISAMPLGGGTFSIK